MKKEAIQHFNTEEYIYPVKRNELVFKIRCAKKDISKCILVYWDRTKPENQKKQELKCCYRDGLFDYLLNSHPRFPFCKRVSHFESDLQILYPAFHFCNDFPVFFFLSVV